ncbi:ATP-binding protein [Cytophagaceae bacterium DM2B3-1]|uniref:ATP-binding protein n=1 Tax=Xanthocytophaga flava TaxID=3048013 RepID=A0ABT7CYQ5_9BACT|nr:ATP-binding protein [Xanthocytophaga flavus]MDJ1498882.1 ATP-binding protein [Xanthocytophaga flavus]
MPEQQNIEYKQSWHEDYLKWICGFANAQGGTIYIGKDDDGRVVGIANSRQLMDELPNKVRDLMGILIEVNLQEENGLYYLEIITRPYAVAISLRGRYYYRSGSTKQELTGNALTDFLLRKAGRTWDDITEPLATLDDIDPQSLNRFRMDASKAGRLTDLEDLTTSELLTKLRLADINGGLKRAALVLFGKDPGRYFSNLVVKMGRFGNTDEDLRFQETEEGNLIHLLKEVPAQLNRKFFTHAIDFEGLQRIERGEYPVAALREMLLNALVHRDYQGSMIQIRMYDYQFSIWNEGFLPEGLSLDALRRTHPSRPRNPIIADVCFKGGYIDAWGRGTLKILNACREAGLLEPEMREQDGGMLVTLFKNPVSTPADSILTDEALRKQGVSLRQIEAIRYIQANGSITNTEYQQQTGVSRQTATLDLQDLVEKKILTNGGKGRASRYILQTLN